MTTLRILVVDDSSLTTERISTIIETMGHEVVRVCHTGREAIDAYRELQPDMVTMDITMPDMDGVQATRLIIESFPDAKIIMVTSHGQQKMVLAAIDAGAKGYILKPVKPDKLMSTIAGLGG
ncbi:response regulator [Burkholderiaceae bacterium DAT-1]|nr:response regulator [Burkholderiaceae bacterium DAT-1]